MRDNLVVIGMGSNIEPYLNFAEAIQRLTKALKIMKLSSLQITKPVGIINQADFINGALLAKTGMDYADLKLFLKKVEDDMGRDRSAPKYGPRNIDLDIVIWNEKVVDDDYYSRDFLKEAVEELHIF
ncbi:2-amino-4-hydroxy-6-hydroxymethyldihydropteridine diphosphokinase [Geofilum sp. OHC36d9]|uniref:2-amino-4-hydroxy-6- hydroxymethyldihydropteridine diphosphokinase n=1 Tax=Geofilum sp. OHC36d9 TaxID=3458413 RepID=UPI004033E655